MQDLLPLDQDIDLAGMAASPAADTLVITVNNRLARRLTLDLARTLQRARQVSELPRIMPLSAWLADTAQSLSFVSDDVPKFRLNTFATQRLWVRTIEAEEADRVLMDIDQAARLAMDADLLMDEWALHVPDAAATDEFAGFSRWRKRYHTRLRQLDAEDGNRGYVHVLEALTAGRVAPPRYVVLAGFAEVSPRFSALKAAFEASGANVLHFTDDPREPAQPQRVEAADAAAEWRAAVRWAGECLNRDPDGRYAIISPQLETHVVFARRVLDEVLQDPDASRRHAYNVAVGRELEAWPAVHAALAWLTVLDALSGGGRCPTAVAGAALLSGYHQGAAHGTGRLAAADARWRRQERIDVSADEFAGALSVVPELASAWRRAVAVWREAGGAISHGRGASADVWSGLIRRALSALGFPGDAEVDSVTFQVVAAFNDALDVYASLTPVARGMPGSAAVSLLRQLLRSNPFQPQRDPAARLDVLGMLEAEGGHWQGVWMLGLTDDVLPASPKPNPLIPLVVLRQAGAPRATPTRERQWAQDIFFALRQVADTMIVSHACMAGEQTLRPSPLIAAFGLREEALPQPVRAIETPPPLEQLHDEQGPAVDASTPTGGGLDVLDTQSRNPMWAFVRHRLGGRALPPYAKTGAVNVRGQFLHRALEIAWGVLPGQDALHNVIGRGELDGLIRDCVAQAATDMLASYSAVLSELEQARACRVLHKWFDLEAQRTPFDIGEIESKVVWQHGPLALTIRLDRLDVVPEGLVIVDYKTGSGAQTYESDWSRARPINLQLPFYASALPERDDGATVGALVLATLHARRIMAGGLGDIDTGLEGVKRLAESKPFDGRAWPGVLASWRRAVHGLADEFSQGVAANIAWRKADLKYCDALPFLRLDLDDDDE